MIRMIDARNLAPAMVMALPMGKTATITEVKVGRQFVSFRTEYGRSRVSIYDAVAIEEPASAGPTSGHRRSPPPVRRGSTTTTTTSAS